jgi:hypothetical protein
MAVLYAGDEAEQQKTPWEGPPLFGSYCLNKKFRVDVSAQWQLDNVQVPNAGQ